MDLSSTSGSSIASNLFRLNSQTSQTALTSVSRAALANAASMSNQKNSLSSAAISSLGQLLSNLATFQSTLQNYQAPQYHPTTIALSSNPSVATASSSNGASGSFSLTVAPIAKTQSNDSSTYPDTDSTVIGTGTLSIQLGTYNAQSNTFTPGSNSPTSINISSGTLKNIVTSVNAAHAGITASISKLGDGYQLKLNSSSTGANNAFQISGDLSALNFDPTGNDNGGIPLVQSAGDASYTVNDIAGSSSANAGVVIAPSITASFYQAGSTTLSTVPDLSSVQAATKNLVDAYNTLQTAVAKEDSNSDSVLHNLLAKQLPSDMALLVSSSYSTGKFSENSLSRLGISAQPTASDAQQLSFDSSLLQQSYTADPAAAATLLAQAAQAFNELSQKYVDTVQSAGKSLGLSSYLAHFAPPSSLASTTSNSSFLPATATPITTSAKATAQALQNYAKASLQSSPYDLQAAIIQHYTQTQTPTTTSGPSASTIFVTV